MIVLALILWSVMPSIRWHYGKSLTLTPREKRIRLLVRLACLMFAVFFAAYAIFFSMALKDIGLLSPRGNPWIRLIQIAGWLGILGTAIAVYAAFQSWRVPQRWIMARIGDSLIALACLSVVWFVFLWTLLHWSLKY